MCNSVDWDTLLIAHRVVHGMDSCDASLYCIVYGSMYNTDMA